MGGEQPYQDDDPLDDELERAEAAPLAEDETPPAESRILPQGYDDHDMPTRQIARLNLDELDDMLAETRLSASVPDDALPDEDGFFAPPSLTGDASDETVVSPTTSADADVTRVTPSAGRGPGVQAVPPTRSYTNSGLPPAAVTPPSAGMASPPVVTPPVGAAPPPPVYGGFEDRPPVGSGPLPQAGDRRRRGRTARERRDSGLYFPWWSLLILLAGVALVATLIVMGLGALGGQALPGGETPVIIVVTSTSTPGPTRPPVTPTPRLPTATASSVLNTPETPAAALDTTPDSAITPAPELLEVRVGAEIEIFDVGTAGLNVRDGAGTGFPVVLIAAEGSRFEVVGGPEEANDFTWWQIRSVDDPTIEGWGVAEFLRVPEG